MKLFFKNIYLTNRTFIVLLISLVLFVLAFFFKIIHIVPRVVLFVLLTLFIIDIFLLFLKKNPFEIKRILPERLSNGDENSVEVVINNNYSFPVFINIIEELPAKFQKRDFNIQKKINQFSLVNIEYTLIPTQRGDYNFGNTIIFVKTIFGLIQRKVIANNTCSVPNYPGFKKMKQFSLKSISARNALAGNNRMRQMGSSSEFEQIKEYVKGDDIRTINWKASARKNGLMVNNYIDEKSQQIYCIINKGRVMKMPFDGLSLLDHSINAALILTNIALNKNDKAGLITFSNKANTFLAANSKPIQLNFILEKLYKEETDFMESDFEKLYSLVRLKITQRSLLVMFTNFEAYTSLERELPYLKKIAKNHLLLIIFFENTEVKKMLENDAENLEQVYAKTIAEKFSFEKRKIVLELNKNGILTLLTTPQNLSINSVNKYLEIKKRRVI